MNAISLLMTVQFWLYFVPVIVGIWRPGLAFGLALGVSVAIGDWHHGAIEAMNITFLLSGMHPFGNMVDGSGLIHYIAGKLERFQHRPVIFYGLMLAMALGLGAVADAVTSSIFLRLLLQRFGLGEVRHSVWAVTVSAYLACPFPLGDTVTMQAWMGGHPWLVHPNFYETITSSTVGAIAGALYLWWYAATRSTFKPEAIHTHATSIKWSQFAMIGFLAACILGGKLAWHMPGPALMAGWVVLFVVVPDLRGHALTVLGDWLQALRSANLRNLASTLLSSIRHPLASAETAWGYTGHQGNSIFIGVLLVIAAGMANMQAMELDVLDHVLFGLLSSCNENNTLMSFMLRQGGFIVGIAILCLNAGGTITHIGCLSSMEATSHYSGREKARWVTEGWPITLPSFGISAAVQVVYTKWSDLYRWVATVPWSTAAQWLEDLGFEVSRTPQPILVGDQDDK